jgi:hypothetical protein
MISVSEEFLFTKEGAVIGGLAEDDVENEEVA